MAKVVQAAHEAVRILKYEIYLASAQGKTRRSSQPYLRKNEQQKLGLTQIEHKRPRTFLIEKRRSWGAIARSWLSCIVKRWK